jgi:hypothetical protein
MTFPNGIMFIPNFIQIRPAVLELNHADRQTWPAPDAFISCTLCKEHIIIDLGSYVIIFMNMRVVTTDAMLW